MKATDLMIGDWVMIKDYPMKAMPKQMSPEYYTRSLVEIEPISLTSEIFEKNGFIGKTAISGSSFYPLNDKVYWYKGGIYVIGENIWQDVYIASCEYVHQLQHILKDLQIEKEITL